MPYADTDFFLAILKETDWLKSNANALLEAHRGDIRTSLATLIELLLLSEKYSLDPERILATVSSMASVPSEDLALSRTAAEHMLRSGLNTLDAFHAASAGTDEIISSDKAFDRVGLKRIPLESAA